MKDLDRSDAVVLPIFTLRSSPDEMHLAASNGTRQVRYIYNIKELSTPLTIVRQIGWGDIAAGKFTYEGLVRILQFRPKMCAPVDMFSFSGDFITEYSLTLKQQGSLTFHRIDLLNFLKLGFTKIVNYNFESITLIFPHKFFSQSFNLLWAIISSYYK